MDKAQALFDKLAASGTAPTISGGAKTIKQMGTKMPRMPLNTMKETTNLLANPKAAVTSAKASNDFARLNVGK